MSVYFYELRPPVTWVEIIKEPKLEVMRLTIDGEYAGTLCFKSEKMDRAMELIRGTKKIYHVYYSFYHDKNIYEKMGETSNEQVISDDGIVCACEELDRRVNER